MVQVETVVALLMDFHSKMQVGIWPPGTPVQSLMKLLQRLMPKGIVLVASDDKIVDVAGHSALNFAVFVFAHPQAGLTDKPLHAARGRGNLVDGAETRP